MERIIMASYIVTLRNASKSRFCRIDAIELEGDFVILKCRQVVVALFRADDIESIVISETEEF